MPVTEGTGSAVSTDPSLNDSIDSILTEMGLTDSDDAATGATPTPSQDGSDAVESSYESTPDAPSPGDSGQPDAQLNAQRPDAQTTDPTAPPTESAPQYEAFGYTVNGEAKTIGEFYRLPGEGVFVPEAQVPRLQQLASRADANEVALRDLHERHTQTTQQWERLTQWTIPGANGPQTVSGPKAFEMQRVALDSAVATILTYRSYLNDPAKLAGLLLYDQSSGAFSKDTNAQRMMDLEVKDAVRDAADRTRQHLAAILGASNTAPTPQADPAPTPEQLRTQVAEHASELLTERVKAWGLSGLTADDVQALAPQLPRYVRSATAEDVKADPALKLGQLVLENEFERMVRHVAATRQAGASSASIRDSIDKFNRGQQQGRRPNQPAPRPAAPPAPAPTTKRGKERANRTSWEAVLERGLQDPDVQAALNGG